MIEKADPCSVRLNREGWTQAKLCILSWSGNIFMLNLQFLPPEQFLLYLFQEGEG